MSDNLSPATAEIAATAARLIVEEGMEYGPAKRKAVKILGQRNSVEMPSNDAVEDEVFAYIEVFCAETQPQELAALRRVALGWMERLEEFRPHLSGAVWRGTATRLNDVWLNLFYDDPKSAEFLLLDRGVDFDAGSTTGFRGETVDVLTLAHSCRELGERVMVYLVIYDHDDLRGALKPDAKGRTDRGSLDQLRRLMEAV